MGKRVKYQYTESMKEFGRYLKLLRCPDYHKYRVKVVEDCNAGEYVGKDEQAVLDLVEYFLGLIQIIQNKVLFDDEEKSLK